MARSLLLLLGLVVPLLAACGQPQATAPAPAAETRPSGTPTAAASTSAAAAAVVFRVVPDQSEARYRVREQLAALQFPSDAVGRTKAISGTVAFAADGSIVSSASKLTVDLTTLQSNEQRRDNFIKSNTLEVSRYPTAEFVPREARGLPWPLPASGEATFQLVGDMTIHGTTRPVTWDVTAKFAGDQVTGTATTSFKFGDFNMQVPRVAVVLSVEDNIRLEVDFTFARIAT